MAPEIPNNNDCNNLSVVLQGKGQLTLTHADRSLVLGQNGKCFI